MNIYVGNLAKDVTDEELKEAFAEYGEVTSSTVLKDKYTGESRGFGFVEMPSKAEAIEAMQKMDAREIKGRKLIVNEARPREDKRGGKKRGSGGGSRGRGHGRW
ncbi:MAG: RNA-binding protein [Calditrichaeota bacterium]|nr:RNA-binding protein [Calditrichota bacterium]RQV99689.1 MAG: RNA-binding protein [Calditrichota bacterium]